MTTASELLAAAAGRISRSDARIVLAHLMQTTREALIMHPEASVSAEIKSAFLEAVDKISRGCPVAYITGVREFWCRPFAVTPDVLVPRPDTETLIKEALAVIQKKNPRTCIDLGTGSGIIAVTLALEAVGLKVSAADVSRAALEVARGNAARLGAQVEFIHSNWFDALAERKFDLIVSNPPYIDPDDEHMKNLSFEPASALTDGIDGLEDLRRIITGAPAHLVCGGTLILEHGYDQGAAVRKLLAEAGFCSVRTVRDLGGNERVSCAELPS